MQLEEQLSIWDCDFPFLNNMYRTSPAPGIRNCSVIGTTNAMRQQLLWPPTQPPNENVSSVCPLKNCNFECEKSTSNDAAATTCLNQVASVNGFQNTKTQVETERLASNIWIKNNEKISATGKATALATSAPKLAKKVGFLKVTKSSRALPTSSVSSTSIEFPATGQEAHDNKKLKLDGHKIANSEKSEDKEKLKIFFDEQAWFVRRSERIFLRDTRPPSLPQNTSNSATKKVSTPQSNGVQKNDSKEKKEESVKKRKPVWRDSSLGNQVRGKKRKRCHDEHKHHHKHHHKKHKLSHCSESSKDSGIKILCSPKHDRELIVEKIYNLKMTIKMLPLTHTIDTHEDQHTEIDGNLHKRESSSSSEASDDEDGENNTNKIKERTKVYKQRKKD